MDVFFNPVFLRHDTGVHPESAQRLELILDYLGGRIRNPRDGEEFLSIAHTKKYINRVQEASDTESSLDMDTPLSRDSYEAACMAVGAAVDASESGGFALVRPPGHHAFSDHGSGFCIFNNMAIAALRLAKKGKRVFIFDIDIHHGNGTEEIVLDKENIQFLSIHQSPLYPGSGLTNRGKNVIDIPLPPETGDAEYINVLDNVVQPAMLDFGPDIVGVSVGFDAFRLDRGFVAGNAFDLTEETYENIRDLLSPFKTFYTLEGGYNPQSILRGAKALMGL